MQDDDEKLLDALKKAGVKNNGVFQPLLPNENKFEAVPTADGYRVAGVTVSSDSWPELVPFEQCETLPPFPLDALHPATREFVYAASEMVQAPVDMVGACVLGTLQVACRGRYPVRLPNGHVERPCFYIVPIAPPSERKSGVIYVGTRPLVEYEIEYNQAHGGEVNQSSRRLKIKRRVSG